MTNRVIKGDLDKFKALQDALSKKYKVKLGIIGAGALETHKGTMYTNVEIGLIQQFGTKSSKKIPARNFLIMPVKHKKKEILAKVEKSKSKIISTLISNDDVAIELIYKKLGIMGEAAIQEAFDTKGFGQWAPNAPYTIMLKGSDSPLIDTGQLRKSITSEVIIG